MPNTHSNLHEITQQSVWDGFKQLVPLSIFVTAFGAAFGLAAMQRGIEGNFTVLMSTLVFAGASQFAALELWGPQVHLATLVITVFAVNARHLLMGATLFPWLRQLSPARCYGTMMVASDANWAMSMQAFNRGQPGMGLLLGGGLALLSFWVFGTWLGVYFGGVIRDPKVLGLDMVMGCFLLAMVVGGQKNLRMLIIWSIAAGASLLAYWYLPANSHVVVGALAGGLAGALGQEKRRAD